MAPGQLLCKSLRAACAPIPDTISCKVQRLESDLLAAPPNDLQARTRSTQEMVLGQLQSLRSLSIKLGCVQNMRRLQEACVPESVSGFNGA